MGLGNRNLLPTFFSLKSLVLGLLLFLPLLCPGQDLPSSAGRLVLMTEEFPPYNFSASGLTQGTSVDIIREICKRLALDHPIAGLQVMPWPRAYKRLLNEPDTVLFAMTRTTEREKLFKWVGPISQARNVLLARKIRNIHLKTITDALVYHIGVIEDDAGEQILIKAGIPRNLLDRAQDVRSNMLKLQSGRIDLFAYDFNVCNWTAKSLGMVPGDFDVALVIQKGEHYFGFNRTIDDRIVQRFQQELDAMKEDGSYQRIMDSYLK